MKWRYVVLVALTVLLLAVISHLLVPPVSDRPPRAAYQAQQILEACDAYRDNPANPERGRYPTHLLELVHPPLGGPPFLRNGAEDLRDPWGNQFEYTVEKTEAGEREVRVWSVREVNGKRTELGAIRKANGEIATFGLE